MGKRCKFTVRVVVGGAGGEALTQNRFIFSRGNLWHPFLSPLFTTKLPINLTKGLE